MEEKKKKTPKLFTWRQGVLMAFAAVAGIGLNAARAYRANGSLDAGWYVSGVFTLMMFLAIGYFVARRANRPEKED